MKKLLTLPIALMFSLVALGQNVNMNQAAGSTVNNVCGGTIKEENGGGNYDNSTSYTVTICAPVGQVLQLDFSQFSYGSGDNLAIYDGNTTGSPLVGTYSGTGSPGQVVSTGNCLTLVHTSDFWLPSTGFSALMTCVTVTPPGDCSNGIQDGTEEGVDCGGCDCAPCGSTSAATLTASADNTSLPCGGGVVNLTALGNSNTPLLSNNFNFGCAGYGWQASPAGEFGNPCGPGPNGLHMWMGSTTAAPRTLSTLPMDVSCGGEICFDLKYAIQGQSAPCEGPDLPNEGVSLQYFDGTNWVTIAYFHPNGTILSANPGGTSPSIIGNTAFTDWDNYCFQIPPGAQTATTEFRWFQSGSSGTCCDHWGIDEVVINSNPCAPWYYDWEHVAGSPDAANVATFIDQDTTLVVHYTNGTDTVTETIFIDVAGVNTPVVNVVEEACYGTNTATAQVSVTGAGPTYTYQLTSGPAGFPSGAVSNQGASYTYTNLAPGFYCVEVSSGGCSNQTCFTINAGPSCCTATATFTQPACNAASGACDGTAVANPSGGIPGYTYSWYNGTTPGGAVIGTTQSIGSLCAGSYTVEIVDASGCVTQATVTITQPTPVTLNLSAVEPQCFGMDGTVTATAGGGSGTPYTYSIDNGPFQASNTFNVPAGTHNVCVQDANGCEECASITFGQPTQIQITNISIDANATCGICNGEFNAQAAGGAPGGYTFSLDTTAPGYTNSSGQMTPLCAGLYTVFAEDNAGCITSAQVEILDEGSPVGFVDSIKHVSCTGGLDGAVWIGVSTGPGTGVPPYQFKVCGANNNTFSANNVFSGLAAGSYCFVIRDANGCLDTITADVLPPTPLSFSTTVTSTSCFQLCDGTATVTASGGTAPYQISTNNGATFMANSFDPDTTVGGLCPGQLNVVIMDAYGCVANNPVTIPEPPELVIATSAINVTCGGYCDGQIQVGSTTGGTPSYTYYVDGVSQSPLAVPNTITGLCAGNFDIMVEDANGCTDQMFVLITEPNPILITEDANTNSTCGQANGTFTVSGFQGTGPYTFEITGSNNSYIPVPNNPSPGGITTHTFTDLFQGTYTVTVTDANGCTATLDVDIVDDASPSVVIAQMTNPLCTGDCNGQLLVNGLDGLPQYIFSVTGDATIPPQTSGTIPGLCAGTYTVHIEDQNGCQNDTTVTLVDPPLPVAAAVGTDPVCFEVCEGTIDITYSGGYPPYTASINGGFGSVSVPSAGAYTFDSLCAGTYDVVVNDNFGCLLYTQTIVLAEAPEITTFQNISNTNCGLDNGQAFVQIMGGDPSSYNWVWDTTPYHNGPISGTGNIVFQAGLAPAPYVLTVTDGSGCEQSFFVPVGTDLAPELDTIIITHVTCFDYCDGTALIETSVGTGSTLFNVNGGPFFPSNIIPNPYPPGEEGYQFTGLCPGQYAVGVMDGNGCPDYFVFEIENKPELELLTNTVDNLCFGDSDGQVLSYSIGGSGPHTYTYNGVADTNAHVNLVANTYEVVVTDSLGCTDTSIAILVDPPLLVLDSVVVSDVLCYGDNSGQIDIYSTGGTAPYLYSLDCGNLFFPNSTITTQFAGTYCAAVVDSNGCQVQDPLVIVDEPDSLFLTVTLTPSTCGNPNGVISVVPTGGVPAYQYSYEEIPNPPVFGSVDSIVLGSGIYEVVLMDANGCLDDQNVFIENLGPPTITSITGTDPLCLSFTDGTLELVAIPGAGVTTDLFYYVTDSVAFPMQTNDGYFDQNSPGYAPGFGAGTYWMYVVDENGCIDSATVTLTDPPAMEIQVNSFDLTCFQNSTGVIISSASGGNGVYDFTIDAFNPGPGTDPSGYFELLPAGPYLVEAVDTNGCHADTTITLAEPPLLTGVYTPIISTCFESCDAMVTVVPSGGTANYLFGTDSTWQSNDTIMGLCAGNYWIYIQDSEGCLDSLQVITTEPTEVTFTTALTTETCGNNDATITVNANGGTLAGGPGSYLYEVNTTQQLGNNLFTSLDSGMHIVTVWDDNMCEALDTVFTVAEPVPQIDYYTVTDPLCAGGTDDTTIVYASSGVGSYTVTMAGLAGTPVSTPIDDSTMFTGYGAGTYQVVLIDANNCSDTVDVVITDPVPLAITAVNATDVTCFGFSNGALEIVAVGGTGVLSYSIDGGVNFNGINTIGFLPAGTYNIVVQDQNGCQQTTTATINEPTALTFGAGITATDNQCYGDSLGTIDATASGGTAPYTYNWSGGIAGNVPTATNVPAGIYMVTVMDANNCILTEDTVEITEPPLVSIVSVITDSATCFNDVDGTITINAPNAVQFEIQGPGGTVQQVPNVFTGLGAGNYNIIVEDANGCQATSNTTLYEPDSLYFQYVDSLYSCYGEDVTMSVFAVGGNGSNTYTWSPSGPNASSQTVNLTADATYTVSAIDQNGCASDVYTIDVIVSPQLQIAANMVTDTSICPGESVDLTVLASGGVPPYLMGWSHLSDTAQTITVTPSSSPVTYMAIVEDMCNHVDSVPVVVTWFTDPGVVLEGIADGCAPLTLDIENLSYPFLGGNCIWTINGATYNGCSTVSHTFNGAGVYSIELDYMTADGCWFDTTLVDVVDVFSAPDPSFLFSPTTVTTLNSTVQFTNATLNADNYHWEFGDVGASNEENPLFTFPDDIAASYLVCLTASNVVGTEVCEAELCQLIPVEDEFAIYVPNVFTPDDDNFNEIFLPRLTGFDKYNYTLYIFNRWGELLFESHNADVGWDGRYLGELAKQDVYVWQIEVKDNTTDEKKTFRGHVTLLK